MPDRPNILFLMTDQMQGRVLDPDHPCQTPAFDRLAARGMRFARAYTPNAVCSPARASLMTGLLPHNHGVLEVTHVVDDDQCCLRTDKPHWAERLVKNGYRTGYFGKWHVERSGELRDFGWQVDGNSQGAMFGARRREVNAAAGKPVYTLSKSVEWPPGYRETRFYGVTDQPPEARGMGITTGLAGEFLQEALQGEQPWCCLVSITEPHDPFICGQEAFDRYDVDALELAPNVHDDLADAPGLYRKAGRVWANMSDRERREAAVCYYASITEIDAQFGRLLEMIQRAGQLDNTIVVLTSDHGELLGAHGLYTKNISAYEEVYNIPLVMAGPGITQGVTTNARVGLHDLCPTLLAMSGSETIDVADSRSFAEVVADPEGAAQAFARGYAEYHGGRYRLTQRVYWDGAWKFVHNGFDIDELYNLEADPYELHNLAEDPRYRERVQSMMAGIWERIEATGDHPLRDTAYPSLRLAPVGPEGAKAEE